MGCLIFYLIKMKLEFHLTLCYHKVLPKRENLSLFIFIEHPYFGSLQLCLLGCCGKN